jgi:hypothetical protein
MTFFYYNLSPVIPQLREVHTILPAIAFSKEPTAISTTSGNLADLADSDFLEKHPRQLADFLYTVLCQQMEESSARSMADSIKSVHKLKHKKNKNNLEMKALLIGQKVARDGLAIVRNYMHGLIIANEMHRTNVFRLGKLMQFIFLNHSNNKYEGAEDERALDTYMKLVSDTEFNSMPVCTEQMTEGFSVAELGDKNLPPVFFENGIVKIKMLELPGFLSFKRNKYTLMRESLMPELDGWWNALVAVYTALGFTDFNESNMETVKEKAGTLLLPAVEQLKKKAKESVYIQQLANDEYGEFGSTMFFAITSRMNLLKAYHRTGQMTDEVFEKLNSYYSKENKQDKIVCFLLHEVPLYPPMKTYMTTDGPLMLQIWDDSMKE